MEVKHQDEEDESDAGSCSKGGKLSNIKMEEKPVKIEECSGEGGKGVPMDTSTTSVMMGMKTEDRKPEVKEEDTSGAAVTQSPAKKKSK